MWWCQCGVVRTRLKAVRLCVWFDWWELCLVFCRNKVLWRVLEGRLMSSTLTQSQSDVCFLSASINSNPQTPLSVSLITFMSQIIFVQTNTKMPTVSWSLLRAHDTDVWVIELKQIIAGSVWNNITAYEGTRCGTLICFLWEKHKDIQLESIETHPAGVSHQVCVCVTCLGSVGRVGSADRLSFSHVPHLIVPVQQLQRTDTHTHRVKLVTCRLICQKY